jgi:hypothetical protein
MSDSGVMLCSMVDVLVPPGRQRRSTAFVRLHRTARLPGQIASAGPLRFAPVGRAVADTIYQASEDLTVVIRSPVGPPEILAYRRAARLARPSPARRESSRSVSPLPCETPELRSNSPDCRITPITSNRAALLPARNRPANRAATFARHTEPIKRLKQKRMLPRLQPPFAFVLKWSAIYASFGAVDTLSGASFTAATYQDGAAVGFSMFFLGVAITRTIPAA